MICPHLSLTALANGVLVCNDNKKFGGVIGMGKRYIDVFGNNSNPDIFSTVYGELPSKKDLDSFTGFFHFRESSASKRRPKVDQPFEHIYPNSFPIPF